MEKLLIATRNPGKFHELKVVLDGVPYEIVSLEDLGIGGDVEEDGETYEENAFKKARFFSEKAGGILTLSDDSGLEVAALEGELGLKTRRWGKGEKASDEEWLAHFLEAMRGVEDRRAKFVCYAVVVGSQQTACLPDRQAESSLWSASHELDSGFVGVSFCAEAPGVITFEPEAPILLGLPLSSCFRPEGSDKVYAALSAEDKARLSHRGWAVRKAREWMCGGGFTN